MEALVKTLSSVFTKHLDLEQDQQQVVIYSLRLIISSIIGYSSIVLLALPLGIIHIVIPMAIMHSILRICSGGAHASTSTNCFITGALIFNILGLILKFLLLYYNLSIVVISSFIIFIIAIFIVRKYAPADVPDKPITANAQKKRLKLISLYIIVIWYLFIKLTLIFTSNIYTTYIVASGWGILWQSFTLTKPGYLFMEKFDSILLLRRRTNV